MTLEDTTALVAAERAAAWEEAARRMAHEIKNPLTPIRLAAERMRRRARGPTRDPAVSPPSCDEGASTIIEEVTTLAVARRHVPALRAPARGRPRADGPRRRRPPGREALRRT